MAVQALKIYGYRSLRDVEWHPGKLNLLVGPNGSGKSNLLQFLEFLSDAAAGRLVKAVERASGMVPLLWNHEAKKFGCQLRIDPVDKGRDLVEDQLTYELELQQVRGDSAYQITKDTLGNWVRHERGEMDSPYWIFRRDARQVMAYDVQAKDLAPVEDFNDNESLLAQIADLSNPIPTRTRKFLRSWRVYHDIHVEHGSPMREPVTTQHVTLVAPDGSNLAAVLHTLYTSDRAFRQQIDDGMRAGFGEQYEGLVFQPAAAQKIQLAVQWRSSNRPHAGQDLSDGTLRFLMLLTALASPEPATLIAIDEPETGLHPSMLPILAEYAAAAAEHTQVILTSHSPVFLDALSNVSPQVTLFHWEDGKTQLFPLAPNTYRRWLERYRLGELFTSGELETLALPPVEPIQDLAERLKDLPAEDAGMAEIEPGKGQ